jgi:hypothetical protein
VVDALSRKVRMAGLMIQVVKPIEEVLSSDIEVEKGKIFLRNFSVIPDLKKEIVELQMSSQEFEDFKD